MKDTAQIVLFAGMRERFYQSCPRRGIIVLFAARTFYNACPRPQRVSAPTSAEAVNIPSGTYAVLSEL